MRGAWERGAFLGSTRMEFAYPTKVNTDNASRFCETGVVALFHLGGVRLAVVSNGQVHRSRGQSLFVPPAGRTKSPSPLRRPTAKGEPLRKKTLGCVAFNDALEPQFPHLAVE
jgi:hypothetical protein